MIDFDDLAIDPAVRRLGRILRDEYGVWVGFAAPGRDGVPIAAEKAPLERPVCQLFMANTFGDEAGTGFSCAGSIRGWAEKDAESDRGDPYKSCHAGLHAISVPVDVDGATVGSVYASGFVPEERGLSALDGLAETLATRSLWSQEDDDALLETIPILDKAERGCVLALLRGIADHAVEMLSTADDAPVGVGRYGEMIGASAPMEKLFGTLRKISRSDSTVLVQGENGTGKELIARAIHQHSRRADMPFVVQNCAAIPAELIESELFGHRKGAFSGAHRDRIGLFEAANHGTFFLDEIGEMNVSLQVKLLRVLQEGTFLPVGDNRYRKVDVRILCATNRDLRELVEAGKFREDLFYRINVITVTAPPLRERGEDVRILADHFLSRAARRHGRARKRFTEEALEQLAAHDWPGNVRELENEVERLVILSGDAETIDASMLSFAPGVGGAAGFAELAPDDMELPEAIEQLERYMILEGLKRTGWNKTQTAKDLGVSRRNLIRKVAHYELEKYRTD